MQKWQIKPRDGHASICQGSPYQTVKSYAWQELQVCRTGWRQKKNKREGKKEDKRGGGRGKKEKITADIWAGKATWCHAERINYLSRMWDRVLKKDFKCISLNMVK